MNCRRVLLIVCIALAVVACGRRRTTSSEDQPAPAGTPPAAAPAVSTPPTKSAAAAYSVKWVSNNVPSTMTRGATVPVQVTVKNSGDWPWPDPKTANPAEPSGGYAVRLGYTWTKPGLADAKPAPDRADLKATVPPGGTATFTLSVTAPKEAGSYELELDLVEELVTWFHSKGAPTLKVPVTVK